MDAESALSEVRTMCLALPNAYEKLSHGQPCFFVERGRQFAAFLDNHHGDGRLAVWLLATALLQQSLIEENPARYFRPPYVGGKGWVGVNLDEESICDLPELIENAFRLAIR